MPPIKTIQVQIIIKGKYYLKDTNVCYELRIGTLLTLIHAILLMGCSLQCHWEFDDNFGFS